MKSQARGPSHHSRRRRRGSQSTRRLSVEKLEDRRVLASLIQSVSLGGSAGADVDTDGSTHVIGAPSTPINGMNQVGKAYLYDGATGALRHELQHPSFGAIDDFGAAVAVDGDFVVIGAWQDTVSGSFGVGSAHIFDSNTGALVASLANPAPSTNDWFGMDVAIDDGVVAVSAPREGSDGVVYLFDAATGSSIRTINHPSANPVFQGRLGTSLAMDAGKLAVTSPAHFGAGLTSAAYVFDVASGNLLHTFEDPTNALGSDFAEAIALDGSDLVVGAKRTDVNFADDGVAYHFSLDSGTLIRTINNPFPGAGDFFGHSVAIEGDRIVVGASFDDGVTNDTGAVYEFDTETGTLTDSIDNPSQNAGDDFGEAVALSGGLTLIGAPGDQSGTVHFYSDAAPFAVQLSGQSIAENQPAGTVVGTLSADVTTGGPFTFELVSGSGAVNNADFTIVDNELRTAASLDFENLAKRDILVRATNLGGQVSEQNFSVSVLNENESPHAISIDSATIPEMNLVGDSIGTFDTSDPDVADIAVYSLVSGDGDDDNSSFTISGNELVAAERFDFETQRRYTARVRSTDAAGLSFERPFAIRVNDVNPPTPDSLPTYDLRPMIDLNDSVVSSNPTEAVDVGGVTFFTATTPDHGTELWRTDSSELGASLVEDLYEGEVGSNPSRLTEFNGKLIYFAQYSFGDPAESRLGLYVNDPIAETNTRVADIPQMLMTPELDSVLFHFNRVGNELFFVATDEFGIEKELWKTDSTALGTEKIKTLPSGGGSPGGSSGGTEPLPTAVLGNLLLFNVNVNEMDGSHSLWRSDGTDVGTFILREGEMGFGGSEFDASIQVVGTNAYFVSNSSNEGKELWVTDGTLGATSMVKDVRPGFDGSEPRSLIEHNGELFFVADDGNTGSELWKSNGTFAGTQLVKDIYTGFASGVQGSIVSWNGHIYFGGENVSNGVELWKSDGTSAGTNMLVDAVPGFGGLFPGDFVPLANRLVFKPASFSTLAGQLWATDGTAPGTSSIATVDAFDFNVVAGEAFFRGNGGDGFELWTTDGTLPGTSQVVDLSPGTGNGVQEILATTPAGVLFRSQTDASGLELGISDGTAAGTRVIDATPGTPPADIHDVLKVGDEFYISAGTDLIKTDGTDAGTIVLRSFSNRFDAPQNLAWFNEQLFFSAEGSSSEGRELWRSDGTIAGTVLHWDINPGSGDSDPIQFTVSNDHLFVVADDGTLGAELWEVTFGDLGAVLREDFVTGAADGDITRVSSTDDALQVIADDHLYVIDTRFGIAGDAVELAETRGSAWMPFEDVVYFSGFDAQHGSELWRTDGTVEGTYLVADLFAGTEGSFPGGGVVIDGQEDASGGVATNAKLVFRAFVDTNDSQLWSTDGTTAGTKQLTDFEPSIDTFGNVTSFSPVGMTLLGEQVYFEAFDEDHGRELWRTDGTIRGTGLAADLRPGTFPNPEQIMSQGGTWSDVRIQTPVVHHGQLFFSTFDAATGRELWTSDGTAAGSRLATDAVTGTDSSYPTRLFTDDGRLYLTADTVEFGRNGFSDGDGELFYVNESPTTTSIARSMATDQTLTVVLPGSDRDGDLIEFEIVDSGTQGIASIDGDILTYTPPAGFVGENQITFRLFDGSLYSSTATLDISVQSSPPVASFVTSEATIVEKNGIYQAAVALDEPATERILVPYSLGGAEALRAGNPEFGFVAFQAGQQIARIPIALRDDANLEAAASLIEVTLQGSTAVSLGTVTQHILTVTDNDSLPVLSLPESWQIVDESNDSLGVVVALSHASTSVVTATLSFREFAATRYEDFIAQPTIDLTFEPGEVRKTIPLRLLDDTLAENRELIRVEFEAFAGATLVQDPDRAQHLIWIEDNDTSVVSMAQTTYVVSEGNTVVIKAIREGGNPDVAASIPFSVVVQGSIEGVDFTSPGSLSFEFAAGATEATASFAVTDDGIAELTETFRIVLDPGPHTIGNRSNSSVLISDVNAPTPSISLSAGFGSEDQLAGNDREIDVTVSLSNSSTTEVRVPVSVSSANFSQYATLGDDFTFDTSDFVFAPGQTEIVRTLTIHDDTLDEGDESIRIAIAENTLRYSADRVAELVIGDNDDFDISISGPTTVQESAGLVTLTINRSLSSESGQLHLRFSGTAAVSGSRKDVQIPASSSIFFSSSDTSESVQIGILDDPFDESTETVTMEVGQFIGDKFVSLDAHTFVIADNDARPTVSFGRRRGFSLASAGTLQIPVELSQPSSTDTTVLITTGGDAVLNTDYIISGGTIGPRAGTIAINIPAGQTSSSARIIPIPPLVTTDDRQIDVTIVGAEGGEEVTVPSNPPTTSVTILGEERPPRVTYPQPFPHQIAGPNGELLNVGTLQIDPRAASGSYDVDSSGQSTFQQVGIDPNVSSIQPGTLQLPVTNQGLLLDRTVFFDGNFNGVADYLDLNENDQQDPGEPSEPLARSAQDGTFALVIPEGFDVDSSGLIESSEGRWASFGGFDTSIGLDFDLPLTAPVGIFSVSPSSSVIESLIRNHDLTLAESTARVSEAVSAEGYNFLDASPIYEILAGDRLSKQVYVTQVQSSSLAIAIGRLSEGLSGSGFGNHSSRTFDAIADQIRQTGTLATFSDDSFVQNVLGQVNANLTNALTPLQVQEVSTLLADLMTEIESVADATFSTPIEFLEQLSRLKKVLHGEFADALKDFASENRTFASVQSQYSGSSLTTIVNAQAIGVIVPPAIGIGNTAVIEGDAGDQLLRFEVAVVGDHDGTIGVHYTTRDGSAHSAEGDYVPTSGLLTWVAGDTASQFVEVTVHGDLAFEEDESVILTLSNPTDSVLRIVDGYGFILNDEAASADASNGSSPSEFVISHTIGGLATINNGQLQIHGDHTLGTTLDVAGDATQSNDFLIDFGTANVRPDLYRFDGGSSIDQLTAIGGVFSDVILGGVSGSQSETWFVDQEATRLVAETAVIEQVVADIQSIDSVQLRVDANATSINVEDADTVETGTMRLTAVGTTLPQFVFGNPSDKITIVSFNPDLTVNQVSQDPDFLGTFEVVPGGAALSSDTVAAEATANTVVGDFTTQDPLFVGDLTATLVPGDGDGGNGLFQIVEGQLIVNGSLASVAGTTQSIRVKLANSTGDTLVQNYAVNVAEQLAINDFGDAPAPYPTLQADDGPRHGEVVGFGLGINWDSETDGTPSPSAVGDDLNGVDDEDGVTFGTIQVGALDTSVTVNVQGSAAKLDAWIDFNGDGSWGGEYEQIFDTVDVSVGDNNLTFDVPAYAKAGITYARFRLSTAGNLGTKGLAADGEVEDHQVTIVSPTPSSAIFSAENVVTTSVDEPRNVLSADLDGDGDMDLLSASSNDDKVVWYENDGSENFTAHTIAIGDGAYDVKPIDVDGDGDLDVLAALATADSIVWYENDGSENFTTNTITTNADGAARVQAADMDGDGDIDVLSVSQIDDRIVWYENNGSEVFAEHEITNTADIAHSVRAVDMDSDGDMDVLSAWTTNNTVAWFENDGNQNFTVRVVSNVGAGPRRIQAVDIDGDGDMDILSASRDDDTVAWLENDGNESFTVRVIATDANGTFDVQAADLDGDGDIDVLAAAALDSTLFWYENDGSQNFTTHTVTTNLNSANALHAADVDGDGDLDVLGLSQNDKIAWYENLSADFGDASAPYPTTFADGGAYHDAVGLTLGTTRDVETDGQPSVAADGDGTDEDGVVFPATFTPGVAQTIDVTASDAGGLLSAWIDFDRDGSWDDVGEQVFNNQVLVAGVNTLSLTVPTSISGGTTYARFRLSTQSSLSFTGMAVDGEVEDYVLTLPSQPTALSLSANIVVENEPVATVVGSFTSTDADAGETHSYQLVAGEGDTDNGSFVIAANTLTTAEVFDFETKVNYTVRIRTTDSAGLGFERSFTVNVTDVDEILPTVVSVLPSLDAGILDSGTTSTTITFSEGVLGGDDAANFELRNQGADGILGNADDELVAVSAIGSGTTSQLTFDGLTEGVYRLTVSGNIADAAGNGLAGGDWMRDFVVNGAGANEGFVQIDKVLGISPVIHSSDNDAYFGSAVAIDGELAVVGAPNVRSSSSSGRTGHAFVFRLDDQETLSTADDTWKLVATLRASDAAVGDNFGTSVSISGQTVVVGSKLDDDSGADSGSAYVFKPQFGWPLSLQSFQTEAAKLVASDAATDDRFGSSVSISGDTIVVGSDRDDAGGAFSGSAYVFTEPAGGWTGGASTPTTENAKLVASDSQASDFFGGSVSIDGETVVVGSHRDDDAGSASGSAYVFTAPASGWSGGASTPQTEAAKLVASDAAANDNFGISVAISGDSVVVGSYQDGGSFTGSAYVFTEPLGGWTGGASMPQTEAAKLVASDVQTFDNFGIAVSIDGDSIVVGSFGDDDDGSLSGSAYLFKSPAGGWVGGASASQTEDAKLVASDASSGDRFGRSVAISGDTIVVGAVNDDDYGTNSGSAHLFSAANPHLASFQSQSQTFDVDGFGHGAGQLIQGTDNAFDGLNRLQIDGVDYVTSALQSGVFDDDGQSLIFPTLTVSGLEVSREITVPGTGTADFARTVDVFTNPTGADVIVPVRIVGNLGSDKETVVFATSDGDTIVEPTDTWFGTDDGDQTGTPTIVHLLRNGYGIQPTFIEVIGDNIVWDYSLTVPAGQTVRLAHFTLLADSQADAVTAVGNLIDDDGLTDDAAIYLVTDELNSVSNFVRPFDYGDAPLPYPQSAKHSPTGPTLGATRDAEANAQPSTAADGDGADDDGVMFGLIRVGNEIAGINIDLQNAANAHVDAWIDFNGDGVWEASEKILDRTVPSGLQTLNYTIPATAVAGEAYARVRISTEGTPLPTGPAIDGEVEDYRVTIEEELFDTTPPSATVTPLPPTSLTNTVTLDIDMSDPAGQPDEPVSGVASYDLYVAVDDGDWSLLADDVPATQTQYDVTLQSNRRYWFRAVAIDAAGNVEADSGIAEANTHSLDVDAPTTSVSDVTVDSVSGQFTLDLTGADVGGELARFEVYVSIDGGTPVPVVGSPITAINNGNGTYSAQLSYQGILDGNSHTYRFYSIGIDRRSNTELAPAASGDVIETHTFVAAASLEATGIDVQKGQTQRSHIRYLDVLFNDATGLQGLIDNGALRLQRFDHEQSTALVGGGTDVNGFGATANGNSIELDFGSSGLGGVKQAGNGFYRLSLDLDDDGQFDDAHFEFFRLFGDTTADGTVTSSDYRRIREDINGDGRINSRDRRDARTQVGNAVDAALLQLIDD